MKQKESAAREKVLREIPVRRILPPATFVALSTADLYLTNIAISLGSRELNPIMSLGDMAFTKMSLTFLVIFLLLRFRREHLFKWLNVGMSLLIVYNLVAIWSWL